MPNMCSFLAEGMVLKQKRMWCICERRVGGVSEAGRGSAQTMQLPYMRAKCNQAMQGLRQKPCASTTKTTCHGIPDTPSGSSSSYIIFLILWDDTVKTEEKIFEARPIKYNNPYPLHREIETQGILLFGTNSDENHREIIFD